MQKLVLSALAVMAFGLPAVADESWPELFRQAVAPYEGDTPPHRFDLRVSDDEGEDVLHYTFDPSQAEKVTVHIMPDQMDREEFSAELAEGEGDIWCDDMADQVLGDVELLEETEDTVTYTYTPTDPDADNMERRVIERTVATLVVDRETAQIRSFGYRLPESFKPVIVARVFELELNGTCEVGEAGRPYLAEMTTYIDVSAMGQRDQYTSIQRVENVELLE